LLTLAIVSLESIARADRIAVLALPTPQAPEPIDAADRLAAELLAKGHRVIAEADVRARVSAGDAAAGSDWAAQTIQAISSARAALTRLDRPFATNVVRRVRDDIARQGGGAGGPEVLVEWALLERAIAMTNGDERAARGWLDEAAALGANVELDPLVHPEDERDQLARRVVELRRQAEAELTVASTPTGADVWLDGERRCKSPCSIACPPGRHFVRVSSPAHTAAVFTIELAAGAKASRTVGLSSSYTGASPAAISSMAANPSRQAEVEASLESMGRFLDVDRVIAIAPEPSGSYRVLIAPPAPGRNRSATIASGAALAPAVLEQIEPAEPSMAQAPLASPASEPWYRKPGYWIAGAAIVGALTTGFIVLETNRGAPTGNLVVRSP
jgi:hypothetical protein